MIPEVADRKNELGAICRRLGVSRLELFGSVATGEFRAEDSGLDLLFEFQTHALNAGYADRYFELLESLEQLFGRSVA